MKLCKIALLGIKGKKRNSILIFAVILISFMFSIVTVSITGSMSKTNEEYCYQKYGTWHGGILSANDELVSDFKKLNWVDKVALTKSYGIIENSSKEIPIGYVDDNFIDLGRLKLQSGEFPQKDNEIVMEADSLSALGYDYSLGQDIELTTIFKAGEDEVHIKKTYTLSGVLQEYTDIWKIYDANNNECLNSAMITKTAAEELLEEAVLEAQKEGLSINDTSQQLFFYSSKYNAVEIESKLKGYLSDKFLNQNIEKLSCINNAAYGEKKEVEYHMSFVIMIFIVTILSALCIYMIQIEKEIRTISLFRSIGITKKQMRIVILLETVTISIPAMIVGLLLGKTGTLMILKRLISSEVDNIVISNPVAIIALIILVWVVGIVIIRMLVLQIAISHSLVGRYGVKNSSAVRYKKIKSFMVIFLTAFLSFTSIYTILEAMPQKYQMNLWKDQISYIISTKYSHMMTDPTEVPKLITNTELDKFKAIPGIKRVSVRGELDANISFENIDDCALAQYTMSFQDDMSGGLSACLYAIPNEQEADYFGKEIEKIDIEGFENGEFVVMIFPADTHGNIWYMGMDFSDTGVEIGDELKLIVRGNKKEELLTGSKKIVGEETVRIGAVINYENGARNAEQEEIARPYSIICSEKYMDDLLSSLEPGYECGRYTTGNGMGYTRASVYTDLNARYISTDYATASVCSENDYIMTNNREQYFAIEQKFIQSLTLLYSGGICLLAVLILILLNLFLLDTQRQRKKYGILRAIGMSKKQMCRIHIKEAIQISLFSEIAGWLLYVIYFLTISYIDRGKLNDSSFYSAVLTRLTGLEVGGMNPGIITITVLFNIIIIMLLVFITKRPLYVENLQSELREM